MVLNGLGFLSIQTSVADPDPPDSYHFPGSGSVYKVELDPESGSVSNLDPTKNPEKQIISPN